MVEWDRVVDVVVVGTGGAALVAATLARDGGAEVLVLEKAGQVGGTTAVSGGGVWVPCNAHMAALAAADSREEAIAYIRALTKGAEPDEDIRPKGAALIGALFRGLLDRDVPVELAARVRELVLADGAASRHERRPAHRCRGTRGACGRWRGAGPLRCGQHGRECVRLGLPERRRHPRQRHDLRLSRRTARRPAAAACALKPGACGGASYSGSSGAQATPLM